jgi:hypothetical protein
MKKKGGESLLAKRNGSGQWEAAAEGEKPLSQATSHASTGRYYVTDVSGRRIGKKIIGVHAHCTRSTGTAVHLYGHVTGTAHPSTWPAASSRKRDGPKTAVIRVDGIVRLIGKSVQCDILDKIREGQQYNTHRTLEVFVHRFNDQCREVVEKVILTLHSSLPSEPL